MKKIKCETLENGSNFSVFIIFLGVFAGGLLGTIHAMNGSADTFTLFTTRAAQEILSDGRLIEGKKIFSYASTIYHFGLESLLASLSVVMGVSVLDLVYLPVGAILYSIGCTILILHFVYNKRLSMHLIVILVVAILLTTFSGGGYVQPFYSVFHQSWGFYILLLYLYVLIRDKDQKLRRDLVLIFLFMSSSFIYYTVNNWLLLFNGAIFILQMIKSHLLTNTFPKHDRAIPISSNFLALSFIVWWLFNSVTSQILLIPLMKKPNELLSVLHQILFREEKLLNIVPSYPDFIIVVNRLTMITAFLPVLIHTFFKIVGRTGLNKHVIKDADYIILLFLIMVSADLIGYGFLGGWYVFVRQMYIMAPLTSAVIFLKAPLCSDKRSKLVFLIWTSSLIVLSIVRYPYMLETVADYNAKLQQSSLSIVRGQHSLEILSDYKTLAMLSFSLEDISRYKLSTYMNVFDQKTLNYRINDMLCCQVIISAKARDSYVWVQGWRALPPLRTIFPDLTENLNAVYDSPLFNILMP
jgi:hypothetical protein